MLPILADFGANEAALYTLLVVTAAGLVKQWLDQRKIKSTLADGLVALTARVDTNTATIARIMSQKANDLSQKILINTKAGEDRDTKIDTIAEKIEIVHQNTNGMANKRVADADAAGEARGIAMEHNAAKQAK